MPDEEFYALIIFGPPLAAVFLYYRIAVAPKMDRERITAYFTVHRPSEALTQIRWVPFGPGWFGDSNRIYRVSTKVAEERREYFVKTAAWSGVYVTEMPDPASG